MRSGGSAAGPRREVPEQLRVLADTNVFVAAVTSREGVSARLLIAARAGRCRLIVSPKLLEELETVLARAKFRRYVSAEDARRYVAMVRELAEVVSDPPVSAARLTPDPDDDYLIALARAAAADVLVSGDGHLTGLEHPSPVVKTPRELLAQIGDA